MFCRGVEKQSEKEQLHISPLGREKRKREEEKKGYNPNCISIESLAVIKIIMVLASHLL